MSQNEGGGPLRLRDLTEMLIECYFLVDSPKKEITSSERYLLRMFLFLPLSFSQKFCYFVFE